MREDSDAYRCRSTDISHTYILYKLARGEINHCFCQSFDNDIEVNYYGNVTRFYKDDILILQINQPSHVFASKIDVLNYLILI